MASLSPKEEKQQIKACFDVKMKAGQEWCVIDAKWWQKWQEYVDWEGEGEGDGQKPGAMDNSVLLEDPTDTFVLKKELRENYDYALVPKQAYAKFVEWYGADPKIARMVVGSGQNMKVDLHPLRVKWKKYAAASSTLRTVLINRDAKVKEFRFTLAAAIMMPPLKVRLWCVEEATGKPHLLDDDIKTLAEYEIEDGDEFIVETKTNDDQWPMERDEGRSAMDVDRSTSARSRTTEDDGLAPVGTVTYSSANPNSQAVRTAASAAVGSSYGRTGGGTSTLMGMSYREKFKNTEGTPHQPGLCGLNNLGNTCFMNSALQCLSNTVPLTNFFLTNEFIKDINRTNPLGMKGFLADHYSILLKEVWSGKFRAVAPVNFKYMLGKFAPQFSGYQQHDCQELLAFLLDGLHEDLNRVTQKPYVETVESAGRPDAEVAAEAWEAHLKRNKSIIVDLFQGQFKSTVICPVCDKVSITFDPFMYLSVPLPVSTERVMSVSVIYLEQPSVKYSIKLSKNGVVTDIKKAIAEVTGLGIEQMGICDIYAHKIFKILPENHPVKQIKDNDEIFCFEIVANDEKLPPEKLALRKKARKEAKLAAKAKLQEEAKAAGEPMETDDGPKAAPEGKDVEMEDSQEKAKEDDKEKEKEDGEKEKEDEDKKAKQKEKGKQKQKKKPFLKYVSVIHRELKPSPLKKGRKYDLFGYPFVFSVDPEFTTNRQIYDSIWHHIQKIYTKGEVKEEDPQVAKEKLEKLEQELKEKTDLSEEELRGYKGVAHYPFTLFLGTNHNFTPSGMKEIPLNDEIHGALPNAYKVHFNVDWTDEGIEKYFNKAKITEDASVKELKQEESKSIPLSACLELFTKKEQLSAEDAWYCSKCQEHREAFKKFDVFKLPKVLVVHLKRFQFTKYWRDKIESLVDFPEVLDMTAYTALNDSETPPIYSLFAVSNHSGSMGFGHYTAYAKNRQDNKWYHFNDSSVSEASSKEIVSPSAYVLFYVRRDAENEPYAPFVYSQEEVDVFTKKMQEEIEAEREKEREKERSRYGVGANTAAGRVSRPSALDGIDDGVPYGPNLPGKGKELAIVRAGDPMDTDVHPTAASVAGYDPAEVAGDPAGDPTGLRARRNVPNVAAGAGAGAGVLAGTVVSDPASVFAAATAGRIYVHTTGPNTAGGSVNTPPAGGYPYPRGPLDPADPADPMQHDKAD